MKPSYVLPAGWAEPGRQQPRGAGPAHSREDGLLEEDGGSGAGPVNVT